MTSPAQRRLLKDFSQLQKDSPEGITAVPMENDIMNWNAAIFGPDETPWEGGTFKLTMKFSAQYPNKAPIVKFVTCMYHPNIYADGSICLDILKHNWSPIYTISAILTSIQSLLTDPNPNSPANVEAAKLYNENRKEYEKRVQMCVEQSWSDDDDEDEDTDDDDDDDDGENNNENKPEVENVEVDQKVDDVNDDSNVNVNDANVDTNVIDVDVDIVVEENTDVNENVDEDNDVTSMNQG